MAIAPRHSVFLLLLAPLLSGCVAESVRSSRPRRGPVREVGYVDPGGGEVRYSMEGWGWFVSGRRRDALRRMRRVCRPLHPVIADEFVHDDADVPYSQDDIAVTLDRGSDHFTVAPYTHIAFDCSASSAPLRAPPPAAPAGGGPHLVEVAVSSPVFAAPSPSSATVAAPERFP